MSRIQLLDPTPDSTNQGDRALTPRLKELRGKTVLLLDNRKPKAFDLLNKIGRLLQSEYGVKTIISVSKTPDYSRMVTPDQLGDNLGKAHFAITGLGD